MDFRPVILFLFLILHSSLCLEEEEKAKNKTSVAKDGEKQVLNNSTISLINICDKCTCNETSVTCSTWDMKTTFKSYKWPNKTLEIVSLENTSLDDITQFPPLSIRKLVITGSKIKKIDYDSFINLNNFAELDLSHNEINSTILLPDAFEGNFSEVSYEPMKYLRTLNLSFNLFHTLDQEIFKHTRDLKVLSLKGNPLIVIDSPTLTALSTLPFLEELDLSYCQLSKLPEYIFHTSHKFLRRIDLSGNKFTTPPLALEYARYAKLLTMDNNPIQFIGRSNAFPELQELEELNLRNMSLLTKIGDGAFTNLKNLQILRIQNCSHLKTLDEYALVSNNSKVTTPLKKLLISDNALQYLPEHFVARWDRLEELDLMNNQWSCDCDNQYLIANIIPGLGHKLMGENVNKLKCVLPAEHYGKRLNSLEHRKLRCLDLYSARPEKDAAILVGILIGLLLVIPVGLTSFFLWKRGYFFCGSQNPGSFSRAFYKRTPHDDI
ncbi:leucine-rich repeat neuronal protein 1-like [Leptopilina heterotoma]|uniref:leucine-rich repeat neuronal protein 1-like n=1 Tax=Leptopilina heterotoma TaxID=63436 RepID=UPI001CA93103|nr:leucine-rich repeat neuronal protein 1-like [Leptopilina heterotoma]